MKNKKILFISHDASRTGAPIFLLNFLKWFAKHSDAPFEIILKTDGDLRFGFEEIAPVTILNNGVHDQTNNVINKFMYRLRGINKNVPQRRWARENIGFIYSNTIANGNILNQLRHLRCPVITHVHELEYIIDHQRNDDVSNVKRATMHYIAASEAVKRNLVAKHQISEDKVQVIHEFIPISEVNLSPGIKAKRELCEQLKIPESSLIVGAGGTAEWRKGPDLFIQLAHKVKKHSYDKEVHFVWVGDVQTGGLYAKLFYDLRKSKGEAFIHFIGHSDNCYDIFSSFDVLALTSREDPFPLVMLEAAALGKPIICFDESGGAKEFVIGDCGYVVPYLDIETFADRIVKLLNDEKLRLQLGRNAALRVRSEHDISVGAPKILKIIDTILQSK